METSDAGRKAIEQDEQLRLKAYLPTPHDRWTIGYGTTFFPNGRPVAAGDVIDQETADALMAHDLANAETIVNDYITVPLTQEEFDALVSFAYNIGPGQFLRSTLAANLNRGDYDGAADEFEKWTKQKGRVLRGLVRRRQEERDTFESEPSPPEKYKDGPDVTNPLDPTAPTPDVGDKDSTKKG